MNKAPTTNDSKASQQNTRNTPRQAPHFPPVPSHPHFVVPPYELFGKTNPFSKIGFGMPLGGGNPITSIPPIPMQANIGPMANPFTRELAPNLQNDRLPMREGLVQPAQPLQTYEERLQFLGELYRIEYRNHLSKLYYSSYDPNWPIPPMEEIRGSAVQSTSDHTNSLSKSLRNSTRIDMSRERPTYPEQQKTVTAGESNRISLHKKPFKPRKVVFQTDSIEIIDPPPVQPAEVQSARPGTRRTKYIRKGDQPRTAKPHNQRQTVLADSSVHSVQSESREQKQSAVSSGNKQQAPIQTIISDQQGTVRYNSEKSILKAEHTETVKAVPKPTESPIQISPGSGDEPNKQAAAELIL